MKIQSKQEKELDYEAWRTTQCKTIIQENRKLREKQYEKRRQLDVEAAEIKEEKLIYLDTKLYILALATQNKD